jgi:hypothetical protein
MREVLGAVEVVGSGGVAHLPHADLRGHGLELAVAVDLAGEAVERVVGEDELDNVAAQLADLGRLGEKVHPGRQRRVAGRNDPARTIGLEGDLDRTNPAGPVGLELRRITQRRDMPAPAVAVDEVQQGVAFFEEHRLSVEVGGEGGEVLDHGVGRPAAA